MLTHYIIVRRDLPLGVCAAMIAHAAGESGALYQDENGRFRNARAVVLAVDNEVALYRVGAKLFKNNIQFVDVVESGEIYKDQYMAIGLVPIESEKVETVMKHFLTLKELDKADDSA